MTNVSISHICLLFSDEIYSMGGRNVVFLPRLLVYKLEMERLLVEMHRILIPSCVALQCLWHIY